MVAAVAMFAAASCVQELDKNVPEPAGETVVFTASVDGTDTKAALNETTKTSEWVKGDKITLHNGTKGYEFSAKAAGRSASFEYTGNDFSGDKFMAVYPAGTYTANLTAKTVDAYIPTYQGARIGTYNESAALAVAYTENNFLRFRNAHALIKFTINGTNIKAVEFYGNGDEPITGNVRVTLNADNSIKTVDGLDTVFEAGKPEEWTGKGTWVKIYSEDEANGWCFKDGATYYAVVAPANFTEGFSVNYILDDDSKIEAVKKYEESYNLTSGTILNLGTFKYEVEEPDHSGWSLPGDYNGWKTNDTYLYEEGDFYVAKNISGLDKGFKFCHAEFGWKGVSSSEAVAAGKWHKFGGEENIKLADSKAYDIYMTKDGKQFQAVLAGSAVPSAPAVVADFWGIIGVGGDWSNDKKLTEEGSYLVFKGLSLKTTDEFKFRKNGEWNEQKIVNGGVAAADTEHDLVDAGQSNMKIKTAGTYDVYVKKDLSKVYFMTSGKTPDQAGKVATTTVEVYAKTGHTKLWAWLQTNDKVNFTGGSWPGFTATTVSETKNGVTYTKKWTLDIPSEYMGKNMMLIFSGSGNQTADSGPYVISEKMYFTVDNNTVTKK